MNCVPEKRPMGFNTHASSGFVPNSKCRSGTASSGSAKHIQDKDSWDHSQLRTLSVSYIISAQEVDSTNLFSYFLLNVTVLLISTEYGCLMFHQTRNFKISSFKSLGWNHEI